LTHGLAVSLGPRIRVNCISPGWIDTSGSVFSEPDRLQHPAGRVGIPQDIADMVLYLCSDKASFITGQNFTVDGGMSKRMVYSGDWGWNYTPKL
jgi:NAD(P)-dependent dehydrogenase (short-subunit alcohol dehydrogenase family)